MHVLIVTQYFWPESFRINDLAMGLQERNHRITVLTGIPNYPGGNFYPGYKSLSPRLQNYNGINILRVPLLPRGKGKGWHLALNYLSFAFFASILGPFFCKEKYDLIFVCQYSPVTVGIPAVILKKIKRIPIMFWVQDLWPESISATGAITSSGVVSAVRKLVRYLYRNSDRILVQSRGFSDYISREGINKDKLYYFPNWAESLYKPVKVTEADIVYKGLPQGFKIMFAGNIGSAQDFHTIISAAEMLSTYKDIHWLILGSGRLKDWVEKEIAKRGLSGNFHLLGRHPVEKMPEYFSLADAMLVTLKKELIFSLTIPSKVQSYLACGKPVVAALDGEGANVIEEAGAGLISPPEDYRALAGNILKLYRMSPAERISMGKRARAYYEKNFERESLIRELEQWMSEVVIKK